MKQNKVFIVGAGPGDPGLITVRAKRLIAGADVILFDSLINNAHLLGVGEMTRLIPCGKRGGEESFPQEEINALMLEHFKKGDSVVRLKGGDPWLFARGGEEADFLTENEVPFEIIPGITSPLAAATYAGIPITHRDYSSSIAIATGHLQNGKSPDEIKIPRADTLIFLMVMKNLEVIVEKIIEDGWSKGTPAALIQNGTQGTQRKVVGSLENIVELRKSKNITPPAIFIVGNVVENGRGPSWFEKLPLFGKRIVLTRPKQQAAETIETLSSLGAEVIHLPTIEIEELPVEPKEILLEGFTDIIFTSENGVSIFFKHLFKNGYDARAAAGKKVFSIGPNTAAALKGHGVISEDLPREFSSEGLASLLPENLGERYFLIPRAKEGSSLLAETLRMRGGKVRELSLYILTKPKNHVDLITFDAAIFTSSMTAANFFEEVSWPSGAVAFCIGEMTAAKVPKGIEKIISPEATVESIIKTIAEYYDTSFRANPL